MGKFEELRKKLYLNWLKLWNFRFGLYQEADWLISSQWVNLVTHWHLCCTSCSQLAFYRQYWQVPLCLQAWTPRSFTHSGRPKSSIWSISWPAWPPYWYMLVCWSNESSPSQRCCSCYWSTPLSDSPCFRSCSRTCRASGTWHSPWTASWR